MILGISRARADHWHRIRVCSVTCLLAALFLPAALSCAAELQPPAPAVSRAQPYFASAQKALAAGDSTTALEKLHQILVEAVHALIHRGFDIAGQEGQVIPRDRVLGAHIALQDFQAGNPLPGGARDEPLADYGIEAPGQQGAGIRLLRRRIELPDAVNGPRHRIRMQGR